MNENELQIDTSYVTMNGKHYLDKEDVINLFVDLAENSTFHNEESIKEIALTLTKLGRK